MADDTVPVDRNTQEKQRKGRKVLVRRKFETW